MTDKKTANRKWEKLSLDLGYDSETHMFEFFFSEEVSVRQISKMVGRSVSALHARIKVYGHPVIKAGIGSVTAKIASIKWYQRALSLGYKNEYEMLSDMNKKGFSLAKMADKVGLYSAKTIHTRIVKLGIRKPKTKKRSYTELEKEDVKLLNLKISFKPVAGVAVQPGGSPCKACCWGDGGKHLCADTCSEIKKYQSAIGGDYHFTRQVGENIAHTDTLYGTGMWG